MTKLRIVVGEFELDASGMEEEVGAAMKNFLKTIEAAITPPQQEDSGKDRTNE